MAAFPVTTRAPLPSRLMLATGVPRGEIILSVIPTHGPVKLIPLPCLLAMAKPVSIKLIPPEASMLMWVVGLIDAHLGPIFRLPVSCLVKHMLQFRHPLLPLMQLNGVPLEKMVTPTPLSPPTLLRSWVPVPVLESAFALEDPVLSGAFVDGLYVVTDVVTINVVFVVTSVPNDSLIPTSTEPLPLRRHRHPPLNMLTRYN